MTVARAYPRIAVRRVREPVRGREPVRDWDALRVGRDWEVRVFRASPRWSTGLCYGKYRSHEEAIFVADELCRQAREY